MTFSCIPYIISFWIRHTKLVNFDLQLCQMLTHFHYTIFVQPMLTEVKYSQFHENWSKSALIRENPICHTQCSSSNQQPKLHHLSPSPHLTSRALHIKRRCSSASQSQVEGVTKQQCLIHHRATGKERYQHYHLFVVLTHSGYKSPFSGMNNQ